jgi:hypothetical protein
MEIAMKKQTSITLAAAVLLAGVSAAAAAPMQSSNSKMAPPASDSLNLTDAQQKTAWTDLYTGVLNQTTPPGFNATVGAVVPSSVATAAVTEKAATDVPALAPYKFAMLQKKLVIINPIDRKIAEVIAR